MRDAMGLDAGISVVVPVFNGEQSLSHLVERLLPVLSACSDKFEIILVNDGSADRSWERIEALAAANAEVRGINLARNFGQHAALLCGIRAAKHEIIVTMDDDLQNPPEEIPKLLSRLRAGYDVVYGRPQVQQQSFWRNFASSLIKLSLRTAMGITIANDVSAFRAIRTRVRQAFQEYKGSDVVIDVLLTWGTSGFSSVEVRQERREVGRSNYSFGRLLGHSLNMITGFSAVPLRIASISGFAASMFGLAILIYVLGRYALEGGSPPGFPFLASIITIFSGAQLLALGIMGEYLARLHFRSLDRPAYLVTDTVGQESGLPTDVVPV
jgi:glycosyltransferase involved in cell wall biosynthesis